MNTSMADAFNLGWKLAAVLQGLARPDVLRTYSKERQLVAKELIEFDEHLTRVFSSHSKATDKNELRKAHADKAAFLAGTSIQYNTSLVQAAVKESRQTLAKGFPIGKRFHSAQVLRCAELKGRPHAPCCTNDGIALSGLLYSPLQCEPWLRMPRQAA